MAKSKEDGSHKLLGDHVTLSDKFDDHNGDYDTAREFIRAYLKYDYSALAALSMQNMEQLRDVLEIMYPEIRVLMKDETTTLENMKKYMDAVADKTTPHPIP